MKDDNVSRRNGMLKRLMPVMMVFMMVFVMMPASGYFVPAQAPQSVAFAAEQFTVTFDSNGGTEVDSQLVEEGGKVQKPVDPIKDGFTFIEWQDEDGKKWQFNKSTVSGNMTLKAIWIESSAEEDFTKPAQNWITTINSNESINFYKKSEKVGEDAYDYYEIGDPISFDEDGFIKITYHVDGQQKWLPATLRKNNGTIMAHYTVTPGDDTSYAVVLVDESIEVFKDSRGNDRTVEIKGLEANKKYNLFWRQNGTSDDGANKSFPLRNVVLTFTTAEFDMESMRIASGVKDSYTYTGSEIVLSPVIKVGFTTLTEGKDYEISLPDDMTNAGNKTLTVTGIGDYAGKSVTKDFTIAKGKINKKSASLPEGASTREDGTVQYEYTGSEIKPDPIVNVDGRVLERGTDYVLEYSDGADFVNADTEKVLTVTISAKGNYTNGAELKYVIIPKKLTPPTAKAQVYNGSSKTGIAESEFYTVTNGSAVKAGKYTATLSLKDIVNCVWSDGTTGDKEVEWSISRATNPLAVNALTAKVKYKKLKKKAQTLPVTKVIKTTKKGQGTMSYTLSSAKKGKKSFKKYFSINKKTGKVTIKKKLKKGTYKVTVKVSAAGNANYKPSGVKTITFKVKVK